MSWMERRGKDETRGQCACDVADITEAVTARGMTHIMTEGGWWRRAEDDAASRKQQHLHVIIRFGGEQAWGGCHRGRSEE